MAKPRNDIEVKELFLELGYKKTTYREIADMVNANGGLITYYYGSKSKLGLMVYNEYMKQIKELVRQQFENKNIEYDLLIATATEIRVHGRLMLTNRNLRQFYTDLLSENVLYKGTAVAVDYFRVLVEEYGQKMPEYKMKLLTYGNFGFQQGISLAREIGEIDCSSKEFDEANIEVFLLLLGIDTKKVKEVLEVSTKLENEMPEILVKKGFEMSVIPQ
jgi:AcrR family transcriptional regulator